MPRMRLATWIAAALTCAACGANGSTIAGDTTGSVSTGADEDDGVGASDSTGDPPADTTHDDGDPTSEASSSSSGGEAARCEAVRSVADATADAYFERLGLVGMVTAVATGGCEPWTGAWGVADVSTRAALTPEHVLRAGSITKSYTAALLLKLAEDDRLALDDTLETWEIDVPSAGSITLRQLLDHTSGLADYQGNDAFFAALAVDPARVWMPQELVDLAVELGPVGTPGQSHFYSNANYVLAAMVAERATGLSWAEAVRERVLVPAGLRKTWIEGDERWTAPTATGYLVIADGRAPIDTTGQYHASQVWSAGAIVGTAEDVRGWMAALLSGELLGPQSRAELLDVVPAGGIEYGLGVFRVEQDGVVAFGHNGVVQGFQAAAFVHAGTATSVAVLHNQLTLAEGGGLASDPTALALEVIAAVAEVP